jgi:ketosteroid isomerase-like protein
MKILLIAVSLWLIVGPALALDENPPENEVRDLLLQGEAAWNAGSIEGYMDTYWKSSDLRFASGGRVTYGWQETLEGYLNRYPDRAAMGNLVFSDLDIRILAPDAALAFGAWRLIRADDQPHGLFTLQLRRFDEGWRIVHDHTSSGN